MTLLRLVWHPFSYWEISRLQDGSLCVDAGRLSLMIRWPR